MLQMVGQGKMQKQMARPFTAWANSNLVFATYFPGGHPVSGLI